MQLYVIFEIIHIHWHSNLCYGWPPNQHKLKKSVKPNFIFRFNLIEYTSVISTLLPEWKRLHVFRGLNQCTNVYLLHDIRINIFVHHFCFRIFQHVGFANLISLFYSIIKVCTISIRVYVTGDMYGIMLWIVR